MKLFLDINAKKIETVISYFDNYLWKVGIQNHLCFFPNMILTTRYLLIYTADHSSGILYEKGETYDAYEILFNQYLKETK